MPQDICKISVDTAPTVGVKALLDEGGKECDQAPMLQCRTLLDLVKG